MEIEPGATKVIARLMEAGFAAYAVGGCVRDALLGRRANDWDICTRALPEQTLALFGRENCIPTGMKHGTVTVRMDGGLYEVTTFRTDGAYSDGRHPDCVGFVADVREDLARRDFTINAMAYNDRDGLVDPFGGQADLLSNRVVRAVGDPATRFDEDALRVMRLYRFAARYALAIEAETARGALAMREKLRCVSGERIREELMKLLSAPKPSPYLPQAVMGVILPEVAGLDGKTYVRALAAVDALAEDAPLRLAALLYPACMARGMGAARAAMSRLRCSKRIAKRVTDALSGVLETAGEEDERVCARFALGRQGMDAMEDILALAQAVCAPEKAQRIARITEAARAAKAQGLCCTVGELAVGGAEIAAIVGGGPRVGATLAALLDDVIREKIPNERTALLRAAAQKAKETSVIRELED